MNRDLIHALKSNGNYDNDNDNNQTKYYEKSGDISNQKISNQQVVVDEKFDKQINNLQNEINLAKKDIEQMRRLGSQLRTNVNTSKVYETNRVLDRLGLEISGRLRDVGTQLLALGNATKAQKKDKATPLRISFQRKLAKDLKDTLNEFNAVKEANQKEAYQMFKHQYIITNSSASEREIQKAFEENNNEPVFIKELSSSQLSKRAYQESQDRYAEMKKIEQSIEELLYTFQDMQTMLVTQNEAIISIENQVDEAEDAVQQASEEMVKAVEKRKSSRKVNNK
ncbi:t-SNARE [Piromyces finnis]|uniref:t-SNARE n=1 Tax=Piromyces finnis TaxID=1754191 RepID=A0A1Y1VB09_9FUNG|nr:t-SNARE [Piromyces finnis]|eukprot:ORX51486.1 t-SNARE [Piromyces finnis]